MTQTLVFPPASGDLREYAAAYLTAGWSLFPIAPGGKVPLDALLPRDKDGRPTWIPCQTERVSMSQVERWLRAVPQMNLAVVTGPISDLAVLDLDGPEAIANLRQTDLPVPKTLVQRTPKGYHALFRWPTDGQAEIRNSAGRIAPHVDVRGKGGYIVVTPSQRPEGAYSWFAREVMAPAPNWMSQPPETARREAAIAIEQHRDRWVRQALLEGAPEGQRNETAARLAGYFHSRRVSPDIVEVILQGFAAHCTPQMSPGELQDVVRKIGRYPTRVPSDGGVLILS